MLRFAGQIGTICEVVGKNKNIYRIAFNRESYEPPCRFDEGWLDVIEIKPVTYDELVGE